MAIQAMWVPGNVAIPEFVGTRGFGDLSPQGLVKARFDQSVVPVTSRPIGSDIDWSDIVGYRGPGGGAYRGQAFKAMLFTFPIPSPVFRNPGTVPSPDPNRAQLNRVFVIFSAQSGLSVNHIFVFDDKRPVEGLRLDLRGSSLDTDTEIVFPLQDPPNPQVFHGISISVFVQFSGNENTNQIIFRSAGADFIV